MEWIVAVIATIVMSYVIPYLRRQKLKLHWEVLLAIAGVVVKAVEQKYKQEHQLLRLSKAVESVKEQLRKSGLHYDDETIIHAIEASVLELPKTHISQ